MTATTSRGAGNKDKGADDRAVDRVATTAKQMADTVAGVAGEVSARLPEAAGTTRDAFQEANRMVRAGSDETLKVVGALSIGFAGGLLLGGAPRILVIASLVPARRGGSEFVDRTGIAASCPLPGRQCNSADSGVRVPSDGPQSVRP